MITLRRSQISDVLGLTNKEKETFEVNSKYAWKKLASKASAIVCNRLFDSWKTTLGTETIAYPSDRQIRKMFKSEIEAMTKEKAFAVTLPVTLYYVDGKVVQTEQTTKFDTFQELRDFINGKCDGEQMVIQNIRFLHKIQFRSVTHG